MPKRPPVPQGTRRFNPCLRSRPIPIAFAGDYCEVAIIYDVVKVLDYPTHWQEVLGPELIAQETALLARRDALLAGGPELDAAEQQELQDVMREFAVVRRQIHYRKVQHLILDVEWPFEDPAPDPTRPETFAIFPLPVLEWIVDDARGLVQAEPLSPKSLMESGRL